jgi:uncharacterized phage protein (TIGR01671 family)
MLPSSGDEEIFIALGGGSYLQHGESLLLPLQDGYYKVMQFAGLRDANGVEIYEGDIVRWLVNTDHSVDAPVGFESGAFYMLDAINQGYGKVYNDWLRGEYTVLGNIYENPELLETKP